MKRRLHLITILTGVSFLLNAQSVDTLTINPIVGNVIDSAEKLEHHMFPYYSNELFIHGVFIKNADSTITLKALLKPDSTVQKQMTMEGYDWIKRRIENVKDPEKPLSANHRNELDDKKMKWSFSFFGGFSLLGPSKDIQKQMENSGLGIFNWPTHKTKAVWNFEMGFTISKKSALNFTVGEINYTKVEGFDGSGLGLFIGNHLEINSQLSSASFNYLWRIGRGNNGFNLGPVIARLYISEDDYSFTPVTTSTSSSAITAGLNLGGTFAFVQNKSWFLALKGNYTWLPGASIGPYTSQHNVMFEETHVRLSTINLGISAGWRL